MNRTTLLAALLVLLAGCGGPQASGQSTPSPRQPGVLGDTWAWDGAAWHRAFTAGPAPRYAAALAYDAKRKVYVLFGGQMAKAISDETWTWDGKAWKAMSPAHNPGPRERAVMGFDSAHQVVVLFGGSRADRGHSYIMGDTWTWDGTDWTEVQTGLGVLGYRLGSRMITAGDRVILFGGRSDADFSGDAWTWGGKTWSRIDKAPGPLGRANAAVSWDPVDSTLVVFGGIGLKDKFGAWVPGVPLGDAWSLSGAVWTQLNGSGPPALGSANAIWDASNKRTVVLLGIGCDKPSDAAWAWDGKAWSKLATPGMSARWSAASAQGADGKALLFGGSDQSGC